MLHWGYRLIFFVILGAVGYLLYSQLQDTDWHQVMQHAEDFSLPGIATALMLVIINYLAFMGYDMLARRYTDHSIGTPTTMAISFVCYAFNFNLGAAVGSAGLKFKMYSERGLPAAMVARIISFCITTHWLGFALLSGAVLVFGELILPPQIAFPAHWLNPLGVVLMLIPMGYLVFCGMTKRTTFFIFGHEIVIPGISTALIQVLLASVNWMTTAAILYFFFQQKIEPLHIAQVFLVGSIMAAMVHVPAGMGVVEAVFLAFLSDILSKEQIIAALLVFRVFFYILPLLLAVFFYIAMELRRP